jgi:hypothetical protein
MEFPFVDLDLRDIVIDIDILRKVLRFAAAASHQPRSVRVPK